MRRATIVTAGIDDPDFWNPKLRAPICFNPPAVRSYLPQTIRKTELILAGRSKAQMFEHIQAALDRKELPAPEFGAMCYMMSKQGGGPVAGKTSGTRTQIARRKALFRIGGRRHCSSIPASPDP
jgi:hypothetical protein